LRSIDYALKSYVEPDLFNEEKSSLGESVSDYLRDSVLILAEEFKKIQTVDTVLFGVFGAKFTLVRAPYVINTARMLANRGQLLEVLPLLRLCLEMICWANTSFYIQDEDKIVALKAQNCFSNLKLVYPSVGKVYGYLSKYAHWGHMIHGEFLDFSEEKVGVLMASARYRAIALALCLVILDIFVEVARGIYAAESAVLVRRVQGVLSCDATRKTHRILSEIATLSGLPELKEIQSFLP
jgi:hypothetical protein